MGWKYIIIEITLPDSDTKVKFPVIFPDKMIHIEVATVMKLVGPLEGNKPEIVSAGIIEHVMTDGLGGESITLHLKSHGVLDEQLIEGYSYFHGIGYE